MWLEIEIASAMLKYHRLIAYLDIKFKFKFKTTQS